MLTFFVRPERSRTFNKFPLMTTKPASAIPPPDSLGKKPGEKLWTVGTLTYTTAGLVALFCLLLWGDFALAMKDRSIGPVVQTLLKKYGASDLLFALLCSSLPAAIGIILGPIIAYKSDRHRGPRGRRIPFILIPLPFAVLSMIGMGFSPMLGEHFHEMLGSHAPSLNACVLAVFGFFWVIFDFASIIAGSVFSGLINDVVPHAVLGRFFGLFRAVSLLCGILFFYYLSKYASTHYLEIFLGVALLFGVGFGTVCFRLKEGEYPPPPPPEPNRGIAGFFHAAKGFVSECFGIPFYWLYFIATLCAIISFEPVNLYTIPFALSIHADYGKYLALTYAISLCLTYPLGALADRIHPLLLGLITLFLYMLVTLWGGLFALTANTFGIALVAHGVLSGIYFTSTASLNFRMLPKANFVQFSAAGGILGHINRIFIPPLIGIFLDQSHHVYRYTYLLGSSCAAFSFILLLVLYLKFLKMGGPKYYVAPDKVPV